MNATRVNTTLRRVVTLHNQIHTRTMRPHIDLLEDTAIELPKQLQHGNACRSWC